MKRSCLKQILFLMTILLSASCSEDVFENEIVYPESIWDVRSYKIERHPTVNRNGFGMDLLTLGADSLDSQYLTEETIKTFPFDLLFYNDFSYTQSFTGDWNGSGNPVIFMNTGVKAAIVGYGVGRFDSFTAAEIANFTDSLKVDPVLDLESTKHRHSEKCTMNSDGTYSHEEGFQVQSLVRVEYAKLIIGNKFRPNLGGEFECNTDDPEQINMQPVFLVKTREGAFSLFMVTLFKGTGADTQKSSVLWKLVATE